jgi:hypothetical protein
MEDIEPGELYARTAYKDGRDFYAWKVHLHCEAWMSALLRYRAFSYDEGIPYGELVSCLEEIDSYLGDYER